MKTKIHSGSPGVQEAIELVRPELALRDEPTVEELEDRETRARSAVRLRQLWNRRVFLFRTTITGLLVSVLIAFIIPRRYTSTTRLMPPDEQASSSGLAMAAATLMSGGTGALSGIATDLLGMKSTTDIFVGILGSRTVKDKLINEFNLKKVYWDRRIESARDDLESRTSVTVDRKSQIITIKVSDRSPQRAAAMAQAYVDELDYLVTRLSTSSARRERIFLEGRLKTVNSDLELAEKQFSQFASKNTAIDIKEQGRAMVDAAASLQGELIATQSELEGLRQIYTDNNVRIRTLTARAAELNEQLQKLGGETSTHPSGAASSNNAAMYPSIRDLPLLGVPYADLSRNAKVQEAIFETLTKEYELAKVQEAKEIPPVKLLDPPDVPENSSFPPRLLISVSGACFVLILAAVFVIWAEKWKLIDPHDPGKILAKEIWDGITARPDEDSVKRMGRLRWISAKLGWR